MPFETGKHRSMDDLQHLRPLQADQPVVLVAEDEAMIRNMVRIALERIGMFVLTAGNGEQAVQLSRKFPGTIQALVSDIIMPKLDGLGLCEQIRRERPATRLLLISGAGCAVDGIPFLQKPFMIDELKQKVRQMVAEATLALSNVVI